MVIASAQNEALVLAIHAGPLESSPWSGFLQRYREALKALDLGMSICMPQLGRSLVWLHDCTTDPRHIAQYRQTYFRQDPWHTHPMVAGDVTTMDKVITSGVLQNTLFFREFMHEHGAMHGMRAVIACDEGCSAFLLCGRNQEQGNFTARDLDQCRALLPHLQQALRSYQALVQMRLQALQMPGSLLLDSQGYLLPSLQSRQLLARTPFIKVHEHRLFVSETEANSCLQALITQGLKAALPKTQARALGHIGLSACDGRSMAVQLLPEIPLLKSASPKIRLLIGTGSQAVDGSSNAIAQVFGLSAAQAQLSLLLVQGHSLRSAAQTLGLSEHTVRTQIKKIYARTACSGQVELVRRILGSTAFMA